MFLEKRLCGLWFNEKTGQYELDENSAAQKNTQSIEKKPGESIEQYRQRRIDVSRARYATPGVAVGPYKSSPEYSSVEDFQSKGSEGQYWVDPNTAQIVQKTGAITQDVTQQRLETAKQESLIQREKSSALAAQQGKQAQDVAYTSPQRQKSYSISPTKTTTDTSISGGGDAIRAKLTGGINIPKAQFTNPETGKLDELGYLKAQFQESERLRKQAAEELASGYEIGATMAQEGAREESRMAELEAPKFTEAPTKEELRQEFFQTEESKLLEDKRTQLEKDYDLQKEQIEEKNRREMEEAQEKVRREEQLFNARTGGRVGMISNAGIASGVAIKGAEFLRDLENSQQLRLDELVRNKENIMLQLDAQQQSQVSQYINNRLSEHSQEQQAKFENWKDTINLSMDLQNQQLKINADQRAQQKMQSEAYQDNLKDNLAKFGVGLDIVDKYGADASKGILLELSKETGITIPDEFFNSQTLKEKEFIFKNFLSNIDVLTPEQVDAFTSIYGDILTTEQKAKLEAAAEQIHEDEIQKIQPKTTTTKSSSSKSSTVKSKLSSSDIGVLGEIIKKDKEDITDLQTFIARYGNSFTPSQRNEAFMKYLEMKKSQNQIVGNQEKVSLFDGIKKIFNDVVSNLTKPANTEKITSDTVKTSNAEQILNKYGF